jgi:hypothetical protein
MNQKTFKVKVDGYSSPSLNWPESLPCSYLPEDISWYCKFYQEIFSDSVILLEDIFQQCKSYWKISPDSVFSSVSNAGGKAQPSNNNN